MIWEFLLILIDLNQGGLQINQKRNLRRKRGSLSSGCSKNFKIWPKFPSLFPSNMQNQQAKTTEMLMD